MARLVIEVDDALFHAARQRALAVGTTLETRVREWLEADVAASPPTWLTNVRARVASFGGAEPEDWVLPRDPSPPRSFPTD